MGWLDRARDLKHSVFVAGKRLRTVVEPRIAPSVDATLRWYTQARPPRESLISGRLHVAEAAPAQMFCLWTGENEMSPARERALESIRRFNADVFEIHLVTPRNLHEFLVPGFPLHPAYDDLALIHRADYLRTYLLHHHGGAYTDVKAASKAWAPMLRSLNADADAWLLGYREVSYRWVAPAPPALRRALRVHHPRLLGNGAYLVKPRTPFTSAWLAETERRLDTYADKLSACPGTVYGDNPGYPVPFYALLGEVFHPLCLRYMSHLRYDERILPNLVDYK